MKKFLCGILLLIGLSAGAFAAPVLYVNVSAQSGGDGSRLHPFTTLQQAFDATGLDTHTIYIAPGEYNGPSHFNSSCLGNGYSGRPFRIIGDTTGVYTNSSPGSVMLTENLLTVGSNISRWTLYDDTTKTYVTTIESKPDEVGLIWVSSALLKMQGSLSGISPMHKNSVQEVIDEGGEPAYYYDSATGMLYMTVYNYDGDEGIDYDLNGDIVYAAYDSFSSSSSTSPGTLYIADKSFIEISGITAALGSMGLVFVRSQDLDVHNVLVGGNQVNIIAGNNTDRLKVYNNVIMSAAAHIGDSVFGIGFAYLANGGGDLPQNIALYNNVFGGNIMDIGFSTLAGANYYVFNNIYFKGAGRTSTMLYGADSDVSARLQLHADHNLIVQNTTSTGTMYAISGLFEVTEIYATDKASLDALGIDVNTSACLASQADWIQWYYLDGLRLKTPSITMETLCIDHGTSEYYSYHAPVIDYFGVSRPRGAGFDIGHSEYLPTAEVNRPTIVYAYADSSATTDIIEYNGIYQNQYPKAFFRWSGGYVGDGTIEGYAYYYGENPSGEPDSIALVDMYGVASYDAVAIGDPGIRYFRSKTISTMGDSSEAVTLFTLKYDPNIGGPSIVNVRSNGVSIGDNSVISAHPTLEADFTSFGHIDLESLRLKFGTLPTKTIHSSGISTSEISGGYRISFAPTESIDNGTYDLILEGSTTMTYTTTLTVTGLQVLTQTQESTPVISNLMFNGTWVNNGDVIAPLSTVEADVTDINPLDINSFIFNIAGHDVTSSEAVWSIIDRGFHFKTVVGPIVPGGTSATYTASTRMANIYGRLGTTEVSVVVNNTTEAGALIGRVINYPNPYSPARGETTGIRYMLSGNLETKIYIFDITGKLLWQRSFSAGSSGGRAGNNFVVFNGMTDMGYKLTNGLYLVKLTAGGKVLGSAKIVVLN